MRLLLGASLSVVNSGDLAADRGSSASPMVLGSTALTMMPATPAATRSSIRRCLDRRGRLLGIFEARGVVRQFALRLLDAGLGRLPEVGGAVDDEGQGLLALRLRRSGETEQRGGDGSG